MERERDLRDGHNEIERDTERDTQREMVRKRWTEREKET